MKAKLAFGAPLYLYEERARPKLGMIQLRCVDDGLSSLPRGDLAKYRFESDTERREQWNQRLDGLHSLRERFIRSDQFERAQRVGRVVHYAYDRWAAEVFAKPR
jgi:hypothetical protein